MTPVRGTVLNAGISSAISRAYIANSEEAGAELRGGDHADVFFPEPAITIAGNEIVDDVAEEARHDDRGVEQLPGHFQVFHDVEGGRRALVRVAVFDEDDARRVAFRD